MYRTGREGGGGGVKGGAREGNWFRTVHPRAVNLVRIRTFVELAISLYSVPQAVLKPILEMEIILLHARLGLL